MRALRLLPALLLALVAVPADAHGTFEANELEVHLLNDEGSDAIEPYGGYDIQDLFIGFAHDPEVGAGAAGEGFYLRLILYGLPENSALGPVPTGSPAALPWTATVRFMTEVGPMERTLSTIDGQVLTSDFDALEYKVDRAERTTMVQRAFVAYGDAGLHPTGTLGGFRVETRVGDDLRDVAPGGIPVPGTNGAQEYPDPTQIDGQGVITPSVVMRNPDNYVVVSSVATAPGTYGLTIASALKQGGQHVMVQPVPSPAWDVSFDGDTMREVEANGTLATVLHATPKAGVAAEVLEVDVLTDVGGRSVLYVSPNGTLVLPDGAAVGPAPAPPAKESPPVGVVGVLLGLGLLAMSRRRLSSWRGLAESARGSCSARK